MRMKNASLLLGGERTQRTLCALSAGIAFVLGIIIGVLIPFYVMQQPSSVQTRVNNSLSSTSQSQHRTYPLATSEPPSTTTRRGSTASPPAISFLSPEPFDGDPQKLTVTRVPHVRGWDSDVVEGIYWSEEVEQQLPRGFNLEDVQRWRLFCRSEIIVKMQEGCGRMQNRLLTFVNGTKSCCRYRQNLDQIQGEIFSFHLSRLLGIGNLPPATLGVVRPRDRQWESVRAQLSLAQWAEDRPIVLTKFLQDLVPAYIPQPFRKTGRRFHPPDIYLRGLNDSKDELIELAQWSDLIVFDYLTANLDRIVNNLYNQQWNSAMMDSPAHNLAKHKATGHLVFLDNESGLLHGYRLLDKYESYHRTMLDSLCVFRRSTAKAIQSLKENRNVGGLIKRRFLEGDGDFKDYLPMVPEKSIRILNNRIDRVYEQIRRCQELYDS